MHTGLKDKTLVDPAAVRHFEISSLRTSVIEYPVPFIFLGTDIVQIRCSEIYQVRLVRTFRFGMHEKIILYRLPSVHDNVRYAVRPDIEIAGAAVLEPQFPASAYRKSEMLIGICGLHRSFENKPVVGIYPYHIIGHRPALAYIPCSETHIIEFIPEIENSV